MTKVAARSKLMTRIAMVVLGWSVAKSWLSLALCLSKNRKGPSLSWSESEHGSEQLAVFF